MCWVTKPIRSRRAARRCCFGCKRSAFSTTARGWARTKGRASDAEMLVRSQKISFPDDGAVMAADEGSVELYATTAGFGSLGELLKKSQPPSRTVDLHELQRGSA